MFSETMNGFGHQGWSLMYGPFSMLLLFGAAILLVWIFRSAGQAKDHGGLATVSEQFARGEIDEKEFNEKRKRLGLR